MGGSWVLSVGPPPPPPPPPPSSPKCLDIKSVKFKWNPIEILKVLKVLKPLNSFKTFKI